jgi:hypothetical protein
MSQDTDAEDSELQNADGSDQFSSAAKNNPTLSTTGLTGKERARYEQVQAEINAMILLEEEKERAEVEPVARNSEEDLWLPL